MTITRAAKELDGIRHNRADSADILLSRVDAVGAWLASQKNSKMVAKLLTECHQLADKLNGGSGKLGVRIEVVR